MTTLIKDTAYNFIFDIIVYCRIHLLHQLYSHCCVPVLIRHTWRTRNNKDNHKTRPVILSACSIL